jgi:hypothetical protein
MTAQAHDKCQMTHDKSLNRRIKETELIEGRTGDTRESREQDNLHVGWVREE